MGENDASGPTEFGQLVKKYREARNLSQERLAALAGLSGGYISLIETGGRGKRPDRDVVLAIAQALQTSAVELLRAAGRLEPGDVADTLPTYGRVVQADPLLRSDQKRVLIDLYSVFVGRTGE